MAGNKRSATELFADMYNKFRPITVLSASILANNDVNIFVMQSTGAIDFDSLVVAFTVSLVMVSLTVEDVLRASKHPLSGEVATTYYKGMGWYQGWDGIRLRWYQGRYQGRMG